MIILNRKTKDKGKDKGLKGIVVNSNNYYDSGLKISN